ncbi:signal peptidase I [Sphingomonas sp. 3-13AW]|uniref:signal peptidase I n=1 Tax=Sphingomonas sp. 3-13AW TaxID=3050450 RepID=UPI003BB6D02F
MSSTTGISRIDAPPVWRSATIANIRLVIICALVAALVRSFIVAPFVIPSESMLPNLLVGDYIYVTKWTYGYSHYSAGWGLLPKAGRIGGRDPERGEVLLFAGTGDPSITFVKRLIGLPGDRVQMRDGRVWLNGQVLPSERLKDLLIPITPYTSCLVVPGIIDLRDRMPDGRPACHYLRRRETLPNGRSYVVLDFATARSDNTEEFLVPVGHYFVLGDNRDNSMDSRFTVEETGAGMIPRENLIGPAAGVFLSVDGSTSLARPWTWWKGTRWDRSGSIDGRPEEIAGTLVEGLPDLH